MATSTTAQSGTRRRVQSRAAVIGHEDIAFRAYELFLERASEHGRGLDDWLRAERELQPKLLERAS